MSKAKIAITIDEDIVERLDHLVDQKAFSNRSKAIEQALREKIERINKTRLAREVSKLDPDEEKRLAEESLDKDLSEWPEY